MMKPYVAIPFVLLASLAACEGGSSSDGPGVTYQVAIAAEPPTAPFGCLTLEEGTIGYATTTAETDGALANDRCLIATAIVDGMPHLIAGSAFDVYVEIPGHDGDSVRHALSTVEDVAVNGTFPMRVLPRAQSTGTPLWSGSLFIGDLDADRRVVRMGAEAGSAAAKAGG